MGIPQKYRLAVKLVVPDLKYGSLSIKCKALRMEKIIEVQAQCPFPLEYIVPGAQIHKVKRQGSVLEVGVSSTI